MNAERLPLPLSAAAAAAWLPIPISLNERGLLVSPVVCVCVWAQERDYGNAWSATFYYGTSYF